MYADFAVRVNAVEGHGSNTVEEPMSHRRVSRKVMLRLGLSA